MNKPDTQHWIEANQRYLSAQLARVRAMLEGQASILKAANPPPETTAGGIDAETDWEQAAVSMPAPAALDNLCAIFGLSPFERDVLLLCAGVELDSRFSPLCAAVQGDGTRRYATFSLALATMPEPHWSALSPDGPLRRWRLVEVGGGHVMTQSLLRIDERVLNYLAGVEHLDDRLTGLVEPVRAADEPLPSRQAVIERCVALWSGLQRHAPLPVINLHGADPASQRAIAMAICGALGLQLQMLRAADIPAAAAERTALARLWEREAALSGSALLVTDQDRARVDRSDGIVPFVNSLQGPLIIASREPLTDCARPTVRLEVNRSEPLEQQILWRHALGTDVEKLNGGLDLLAAQFSLAPSDIRAASAMLPADWPEDGDVTRSPLWQACRDFARPRLDELAQRIIPVATWEDLVLPEAQRQTLRAIAVHLRQRIKVYDYWGFAAKGSRGLGISALFSGASGTGKTMAAEVLSNDLNLDLYRIDLSQVVNKYIGETEKNLRRVFDAAEQGGAILLFDEADALFGKRSEVKDSHDRYANIEVSYLLQRMEAYRGLAILTTNLKDALDAAFLRRLRFIVPFPFPDAALRAEIWQRIFPRQTPTQSLDVRKLARLNVAGGNIRNIALNAAFLAAHEDQLVGMGHLLKAARGEYAKLERNLSDAEIGGWA